MGIMEKKGYREEETGLEHSLSAVPPQLVRKYFPHPHSSNILVKRVPKWYNFNDFKLFFVYKKNLVKVLLALSVHSMHSNYVVLFNMVV